MEFTRFVAKNIYYKSTSKKRPRSSDLSQNNSVLLLPWLVQQSVELLIGIGLFVVYALAGFSFSFFQILLYAVSGVCATYFTYAVLSHYILMRRMARHSTQVISSVMNGNIITSIA